MYGTHTVCLSCPRLPNGSQRNENWYQPNERFVYKFSYVQYLILSSDMLNPTVIKISDFWFLGILRNTYAHLAGHRCSAGNIVREALVWSFGRMVLTGENWSTREKPAPLSRCPPQIPRDVAWDPTGSFSVRGWWMTAWDMTADWGRCTGLSVRSKCEVFGWLSDRTGWRDGLYMQQDCQLTVMTCVHATGLLSVDGYDFCTCNRTAASWHLWLLYMQQDCQLTVITSVHATGLLSVDGYDFCTSNRTVSWRLWLLYMQQDCQLTVVTSVHATGLLSVDVYDFCTRNRTVSWWLWLLYMQQDCCQLTVMTSVHATGLSFDRCVHATGLSVDGYDFCTCNRTVVWPLCTCNRTVSWRLWLVYKQQDCCQLTVMTSCARGLSITVQKSNRPTSGTEQCNCKAALWLFLDFSVIFAAEEASLATRGATKVLPKPLVCNGNQRHSIISQILHQAAARKVMNLVYCLQRRLPAYWWPHPSVSNPPFLIKYLLT